MSGIAIRLALAATALSLWFYIPYRYVVRAPRFDGGFASLYALLFPLAALLGLGALVIAWRPDLLRRLAPHRAARATLGVYGGAWLLMGLACLPMLTQLTVEHPASGAFAMIHMTAQHVFMGLGALVSAWLPEAVALVLEGRRADPTTAVPEAGSAGQTVVTSS